MYTNWLTSAVTVTVSVGWSLFAGSWIPSWSPAPVKFVLSLATTLVRRRLKVKVDTWINKQQRRRRSNLSSGVKVTLKKTFRWAGSWRRARARPDEIHNVVVLNAGMKYKDLAKRRLEDAQASFEAAAVELRAAEREMKDAERYVKSLKPHCKFVEYQDTINDVVVVEHTKQYRGESTQESMEEAPTGST